MWGIVLNTFRETVRRPFYFLLVATAAAALLITLRLPLFTFGNDTDMYKDLGLSFILVFVLLMALLAAAINFPFIIAATLVGGLAFGLIRELSGGVLAPLAAHAAFDLIVYAELAEAPWWVWA